MNTSENFGELAAALAKAQGEMENPAKDAENPFFHNKYADMASGLNVIRPALSKHGLCVVQVTRMDDDFLMLDTRLIHASGQWIEATYPVCKFPAEQQKAGSALTYVRRYSLFALVGIAGEAEDDGNEASKKPTESPKRPPPRQQRDEIPPRPIDEDRFPGDPEPEQATSSEAAMQYASQFADKLVKCTTYKEIAPLWKAEHNAREFVGITERSPMWTALYSAWANKGKEISSKSATQ